MLQTKAIVNLNRYEYFVDNDAYTRSEILAQRGWNQTSKTYGNPKAGKNGEKFFRGFAVVENRNLNPERYYV